ncbi:MAG TPA: hypothetical protein VG122_13610 [Gemmata sp.]|jgi:hypothetical protein|nr:hypothetical protein [Gemmata sp.]
MKEFTVYQLTFKDDPTGLIHFSFEADQGDGVLSYGPRECPKEYKANSEISCIVEAPDNAKIEIHPTLKIKVLTWDFDSRRPKSFAHQIVTFAKYNINGFRIAKQVAKQEGDS